MSNRIFSEEEIREFSLNVNVESVSERSIRFTRPFKAAMKVCLEEGVDLEEFLKANHIDPAVLGEQRVIGIMNRLNAEIANSPEEHFKNVYSQYVNFPNSSDASLKKRVSELEAKSDEYQKEIDTLKEAIEALKVGMA